MDSNIKKGEYSIPTLNIFYKAFLIALLGIGVASVSVSAKAKPQGGQVEAGDITISSDSGNAIDTLITQQSQIGIINWQSLNIRETEHTHFAQPNASAITLIRVSGGNVSSILGQLTATGQIFLINPSGILFGPNAQVDVSGLLATTANITNENFFSGNYYFLQGPGSDARIINQGYIKVADNGFVFFVAPGVENAGLIEDKFGKIILGSTPANSTYDLDFYGNQLLQFALPSDVESNIDNAIIQSGQITTHGGTVFLLANTAKSIVDKAINMSGIIEANTISNKGGQITLSGGEKGTVSVTGKITACGNKPGERGGKVTIEGEKVDLLQEPIIDVSGVSGGGEVLIGADYLGNNIVSTTRATYVSPYASIFANAIASGDGGRIIFLSDDSTRFYGTAKAIGGIEGGDGGFVETSSKNWLDVHGATIDVSATDGDIGSWLLDPYNIDIISGSPPPPSGGTWDTSGDPYIWSANTNNSQLYIADILTNLASANVSITTGLGGSQAGNIELQADLNYSGVGIRTLSLIAATDIDIYAAATGSNLDLILTSSGEISISNNGINLRSLLFQGQETNIDADAITTAASQIYNDPVILGVNTLLTTTGTGNIFFADTVDGGSDLGIDAQGDVTFSDTIGGVVPLGSLDIQSTGTTNINTDTITTTGTQTYNGTVVLGTSVAMTASTLTFGESIAMAANSLTLNVSGSGTTVGGAISGSGMLTKLGNGTAALDGANTYTGATNVSAGMLLIEGSTASGSAVTVAGGATLGGTGTINGTVTVSNGGTLAPGESAGILSTGDLALNAAATFAVELNGTTAGDDYDRVDVTGAVDPGGATLDITVGFTPSQFQTFTIVDNDGSDAVVNTFSGLDEGDLFNSGRNRFRITYTGGDGNDVVLTYDVAGGDGGGCFIATAAR